jgi:hypothetical protein
VGFPTVLLKKLQNNGICFVDSSVYGHKNRMIRQIDLPEKFIRIDELMVALNLLYPAYRPLCTGRTV